MYVCMHICNIGLWGFPYACVALDLCVYALDQGSAKQLDVGLTAPSLNSPPFVPSQRSRCSLHPVICSYVGFYIALAVSEVRGSECQFALYA